MFEQGQCHFSRVGDGIPFLNLLLLSSIQSSAAFSRSDIKEDVAMDRIHLAQVPKQPGKDQLLLHPIHGGDGG